MNTERTIKTRKVWVIVDWLDRPIDGTLAKTEQMALVYFTLTHGPWDRMQEIGYRVVRAELRYPVKGKERKR